MPDKDNGSYYMNTVFTVSPKQEAAAKCGSVPKYRYPQNKQKNQNKYDNHKRYDNQRKYDDYDTHDNYNRHDNPNGLDSYNRQDNPNRHDNYNRYENRRYNNYNKHDNHNRYNNQNRFGNQNRHDNYNRRDNYSQNRPENDRQYRRGNDSQTKRENSGQGRQKSDSQNRRDTQDRQQGNTSRSQSVQQLDKNLIIAHTWRVVCDSMLGGLSSRLRMCGVDCKHVLFDQGGKESATLAMTEYRFLLTRHKNYTKVRYGLYIILLLSLLSLSYLLLL